LRSTAPDYTSYHSEGHAVRQPSPEFEAWVKSTGAVPETAAENSLYYFPGRIALLGWSRDPRAVLYLRDGLSSRNYMIQIAAAKGLAEIGDQNSIPLIIEACRKAPKEVAEAIAESLIYFDDEVAQAAVDRFIPKDIAKIYRDARANGNTNPLSPPLYGKSPN
jgi:HEAT repeat protein